ncbi:hypothetical protein HO918_04410 [Streptococcus suis]|uniref:Uncharacterized protein n=1 Tax=Streptococcus suis TaxID=1307 RepID=A0A0Z8EV38_STRSU|nr:hypothetical protein [Streptococcus suis]NQG70283.1 hypothetical protein [Streptococcus suis]NQH22539.1 hypothetical protein [Streptococcus suis]NQH48549.1 hypothetical protein [Streptococcus suis]NQI43963.1 hypothetical protein [Streptococcus suis]NQN39167.1 hypothetical protein [Streptococcus suis]
MNKRMKKKYKPINELWDCLEWFGFRLNRHSTRLDGIDNRLDNLEGIHSVNVQAINQKFKEYDKQIESLESEIKRLKKPFWKH